MPTTPTVEQLQRALALAEQIQKLEEEYAAILGGASAPAPFVPSSPAPAPKAAKAGKPSPFSAEHRAKLAAAAKARWAKKNAGAPVPEKAAKKKRILSPEGRARIIAAVKARHAAARKAK
jgi:hypothetical protein